MVKVALRGTTIIATSNLAESLRLANAAGVACPQMLWHGVGASALEDRPMFIQEFLPGVDATKLSPNWLKIPEGVISSIGAPR